MKLLQFVVFGYLLCCILDTAEADINKFFVNIGTEVGNAVSTAWNSLVTAIKKPVRIRSMRRKRRTTTTPSSDTYRTKDPLESYLFTSSDQSEADIDALNGVDNEYSLLTPFKASISYTSGTYVPETAKPRIPVIHQPEWKSMMDWTSLQRPTLLQLIQEIRERRRSTRGTTVSPTETIISDSAERTKRVSSEEEDDEDRHFGINTSKSAPSEVPPLMKSKRGNPSPTTTTRTIEALSTEDPGSIVIHLGKYRINLNYKWLIV